MQHVFDKSRVEREYYKSLLGNATIFTTVKLLQLELHLPLLYLHVRNIILI